MYDEHVESLLWISVFSNVLGMQMHPGYQAAARTATVADAKEHWLADVESAAYFAEEAVKRFRVSRRSSTRPT